MMKWIWVAIVAAVVIYGFCGCGGEPFVTSYGLVDPVESGAQFEAQAATRDSGVPTGLGVVQGIDARQDESSTDAAWIDANTSEWEAGEPESSDPADTGTDSDAKAPPIDACGSDPKYGTEAVNEIASGTVTLCLNGTCASGYCCFPVVNPGDICVAD